MAHGQKSGRGDGHNDPDTFIRAVESIAERVVINDTDFDIPYTAGIARSGWRIYIDRHVPKVFVYNGIALPVATGLAVHEWVEWLIETAGGRTQEGWRCHMYVLTGDPSYMQLTPPGAEDEDPPHFAYELAHQLAQHLERQWVEYNGVDWDAYSEFFDPFIKKLATDPVDTCPADLYLIPYEDENDIATLRRIHAAGGPRSDLIAPPGGEADG